MLKGLYSSWQVVEWHWEGALSFALRKHERPSVWVFALQQCDPLCWPHAIVLPAGQAGMKGPFFPPVVGHAWNKSFPSPQFYTYPESSCSYPLVSHWKTVSSCQEQWKTFFCIGLGKLVFFFFWVHFYPLSWELSFQAQLIKPVSPNAPCRLGGNLHPRRPALSPELSRILISPFDLSLYADPKD